MRKFGWSRLVCRALWGSSLVALCMLPGACTVHPSGGVGRSQEAVKRSTVIDTAHPYSVRIVSPFGLSCTGTVINGGFVVSANHCFANASHPFIASADAPLQWDPSRYRVVVDFSGNESDNLPDDHFEFTPTNIRTSWYEAADQARVDMALLYFAPGADSPHRLFDLEFGLHPMVLPKVLTSASDNNTPTDHGLDKIVVHVQFDAQALFTAPGTGTPPHRFNFFGYGENSLTPSAMARVATRVAPYSLTNSTVTGSPLPNGPTPRVIRTTPPTSTDGYLFQGDSGGGLITTKALSGIPFPTNNVNEEFLLSDVMTCGGYENPLPHANHAFLGDAFRGPMLEGWMRDFIDDADQDGIPDFRDNCPVRANYMQLNSNFDAERKLWDPTNPTAGRLPQPGESNYTPYYQAMYPGNNCEQTPVAHLTKLPFGVQLGSPTSCPTVLESFDGQTTTSQNGGQCWIVAHAAFQYDGYRAVQPFGTQPLQGHVYPSICQCELKMDESRAEQVRRCDTAATGCRVARPDLFPGTNFFLHSDTGWNRMHETAVLSDSPVDLSILAFQSSYQTSSYRQGWRGAQPRSSVWDVLQDLPAFNMNPEGAILQGVVWSHARTFTQPGGSLPSYESPRANAYVPTTVLSYREPYQTKYLSFGPFPSDPVPRRRVPWSDEGYRVTSDVRGWILSVPQTGGGTRIFEIDKAHQADVSSRFNGSTLKTLLGEGTSTSLMATGFGANYNLPGVEISKADGDVLSEMRWDGNENQFRLVSVPSGGYMPGAVRTAALDDVHGRLWETNDMGSGSYKYVTLRQRQWNGAFAPFWYLDVTGSALPTAFFPITTERAAVGVSISSDNKLRMVRYEVDRDSVLLWERPVFPGAYTITIEPDGVQGGVMTIRAASGHAVIFTLSELGTPTAGFVTDDHVLSSVLVNEDGFAYVASQTPTDTLPPLKVATHSWDTLKDVVDLAVALENGF